MGKGTKFSKFGKSAKSVRNTSERMMRTKNTSLNDDYPADKYKIVSVKRTTSKSNKALEKTSGVKIFDVKVKKRKVSKKRQALRNLAAKRKIGGKTTLKSRGRGKGYKGKK